MPGMTAHYSHGGPEWDRKLRHAVESLEKGYPLSYGLSYEAKAVVAGKTVEVYRYIITEDTEGVYPPPLIRYFSK
jgi:hypothetical protein